MKFFKSLCLVLALVAQPAFSQLHVFPAQDTNNTFTGKNAFGNINRTYYAGSSTYATIQAAINAGCSDTGSSIVNVLPGTNAGTDITTLTGCAKVSVQDDRGSSPDYYAYVSGAYVKQATSGSGLSNQTPNYLPLANSATTSNVSSHFYENSNTSGLANHGFLNQKSTANCHNSGLTFTGTACDEFDYWDDGSATGSTPRNLQGLNINFQAWGPAGDGGAEGRTTTMFGGCNNCALVHPGIKYTEEWNTNMFGIGDSKALDISEAFHAGMAYSSDQGSQGIYAWFGQRGYWSGTVVTGGTNTSPAVTTTNKGCLAQENQTCMPIPGHYLLDRSVVIASGKITGACTTASVFSWLGSCPTDQTTLPIPAAWGTAINVNFTSDTTWDAPVAQTFTIGAGGGTGSGAFAAGDLACVIGNRFSEQRIITSVSGTAGSQTITIPLSQPENSVLIAKGACGHLVQDADSAKGIDLALPTISLDGSHILSEFPMLGGMNPYLGTGSGTQWATYDGGANSGFHVYAGARVDRIDTTRPTWNPFESDALVLTLEPNAAFNVGDNIYSPDFGAQKLDGMVLTAFQDVPSNSSAQLSGLRLHIGGHGANGGATALHFGNDEDTASYTPWGGPLGEPNMMDTEYPGVFGNVFTGNYTPLYAALYFNNHQPGQTSYDVLRDPSWGELRLDNTSTWSFLGSSISLPQGSVSGQGGFFNYGVRAGEGDGASNGAGIHFTWADRKNTAFAPEPWLTPCDLTANINALDLCVTDQGASRSGYTVTANRGLQAGHLTSTGDVTVGGNLTPLSGNAVHVGSTDTSFTGITLTNTGTNGDQWGVYSVSSGGMAGGHRLGVVNNTVGNWAWLMEMDTVSSGFIENPSFLVNCWSSAIDVTSHGCDTGLSRTAAGTVAVGNGTPGDTSGTIKGNVVLSGVTAGTSPVCPNGTGGALTTTGCTGGTGGGTPGGTTGQIQYNNGGAFGGATNTSVDSSGNVVVNSIKTGGTGGTTNVYYTSPSAGVANIGASSGASDATVNAGGFYTTGIVDGRTTVTTTTALTYTLSNTIMEEFSYFTGTGSSTVAFTLPSSPQPGMKKCIGTTNVDVPLTLHANTGQTIIYGTGVSTSGGYVDNSSLGSSTCAVAITSTQWMLYPGVGTWVTH